MKVTLQTITPEGLLCTDTFSKDPYWLDQNFPYLQILPITVFLPAGLLSMNIPKKTLIPTRTIMMTEILRTARRSWM